MKLLFGILFIICSNFVFADRGSYSEIKEISIESRNYYIMHFHNWSDESREERFKMITSENQNIFDENNNYAYVRVVDKNTNEIILNIPSPALTHLSISEDEQYILGISNIMLWNPYQLIIININGEIIKKRHITPLEAKMNENEFNIFRNNFPNAFLNLQINKRIYYVDRYYFIDFFNLTLMSEAFSYLLNYNTNNNLSNNISSSVTNWIFWFNEQNPNINFNYRNDELFSINITDPKNNVIEIMINEN